MIYKIEISEREKGRLEDALQAKINLHEKELQEPWIIQQKPKNQIKYTREEIKECIKLQKKLHNLSLMVK